MRIIFSRKGFDSATGRVPSPTFRDRDDQMLSLPIPDKTSEFKYRCITGNSPASIAELVRDLTNGKIQPSYGVHLDPDLDRGRRPRGPGWRPLFGQADAAQSHLENHGVSRGDIFLFFGLFRRVERIGVSWRHCRNEAAKHVIWGWLQIDEMIDPSKSGSHPAWARYHPHFSMKQRRKNMVYVAGRALDLPGLGKRRFGGAGIFPRFAAGLQLTAPNCEGVSSWLLPNWIHPKGRESILTYHGKSDRWRVEPQGIVLSTVGRGQEFVLDCEHYQEAVGWLANLVKRYSSRID